MVKCNGTGGTALIFRKSSPPHLILICIETDFLTVQQSEDLQKLSGNPSPLSEEELKDFYLKLARLVNPNACSANRSDFEVLNILCKDLKRNLGILCKYTQHAWDEGILEIQMASASSVVRKMHAEYTRHLINVEYLLKQFSKDKKAPTSESDLPEKK